MEAIDSWCVSTPFTDTPWRRLTADNIYEITAGSLIECRSDVTDENDEDYYFDDGAIILAHDMFNNISKKIERTLHVAWAKGGDQDISNITLWAHKPMFVKYRI
jgi:hypothetical protein